MSTVDEEFADAAEMEAADDPNVGSRNTRDGTSRDAVRRRRSRARPRRRHGGRRRRVEDDDDEPIGTEI